MSAYQPRGRHPLALTLIVAGHGAVLTALMLSKMDVPFIEKGRPTTVIDVPIETDPPPPPPPVDRRDRDEPSQTPSVLDSVPTRVPLPDAFTAPPTPADPPLPVPDPDLPYADRIVLPPVPVPDPLPPLPPAPNPVRTEASRDPRADFQPPYPDSLRAQGEEGRAVVRVRVGTDGRVKAAEEVRATHPAFMSATVRHARARWRFRPATIDGKPVESWKQVTVTFTLDG